MAHKIKVTSKLPKTVEVTELYKGRYPEIWQKFSQKVDTLSGLPQCFAGVALVAPTTLV